MNALRTFDPYQKGLVSIVICVYNAGPFLRASVESALAQTYTNLEILIVDDGSTDGCFTSIEDIIDDRIKILRQVNMGKPAALNRALAVASGEFYAIQDADDLSHERRIELQIQYMNENPTLAAVFCGYDLLIDGQHVAPRSEAKDKEECLRDILRLHMPGHDPTAMYRREMVSMFSYDDNLRIVEGYDYVIRVGERFSMAVIGECLYSYRIHWESVTRSNPSARYQMMRQALRKAFERRKVPFDGLIVKQWEEPAFITNRVRDNDIVSHFMASTVDIRHSQQWMTAIRTALVCLKLHPTDPYYYRPMLYALAPIAAIDWYRRRRKKLGNG